MLPGGAEEIIRSGVAPISHGEVIEALVANRLTAPAPLVQVEAWAATMAVDEVYGIEPRLLNDDRLGRALDAVAPVYRPSGRG